MKFAEKKYSIAKVENLKEPEIIIKRSADAPPDVKQNPFYDPEFWGRADSPDNIFLPDCDEAISFAVAAHEIGHLVKDGERNDARLDNFEATRAEEQRAWEKGWKYLLGILDEYYTEDPESALRIRQSFERIKTLSMIATDLSKDMYLERGALDNLTPDEIQCILIEKREILFSTKQGSAFKSIIDQIKKEKTGTKPDWNKFIVIVTKAVKNILKDNKK
jgi:hypothetical protein